jgi:hypothetical protein
MQRVIPEWVRGFGSDSYFNVELPHSGIALDLYGNIYVTSQFTDKLVIDGTVLESQGDTDAFVAKLDPTGRIGMDNSFRKSLIRLVAKGIDVDVFGNSFIVGKFDQFLNYDNRTLNSRGGSDIFIVKVLPDGNVQWAKESRWLQARISLMIFTLTTHTTLIITGSFQSRQLILIKSSVASQGGYDMFIAKYTPEGNCLWVKSNGGFYHDEGTAVATIKRWEHLC